MSSQVKLILLASAFGQSQKGLPTALSDVGGVPAINHWIAPARNTARLQPLKDRVFIVCSQDNYHEMLAWASDAALSDGGFPASNIIPNGTSTNGTSPEASPLADLALATRVIDASSPFGSAGSGASYHLVVAFADLAVPGPGFSMQRVVEHGITRGKDNVTYVVPAPGASMEGEAEVRFEDADARVPLGALSSPNPKVASIEASGSGTPADGMCTAALAPVYFLHRSSLPELLAASASGSGSRHQVLAGVLSKRVAAGKPVYAQHVDVMLDITSPAGLGVSNAFLAFFADHQLRKATAGPAAVALAGVTRAAMDAGVVARGAKDMEALLSASSEVKRAWLQFYATQADKAAALAETAARGMTAEEMEAAAAEALTQQFTAQYGVHETLPARFADPTTRRHNPRQQHPVYATTNNDYGYKTPTEMEMPDSYAGSTGRFTNTFYGGMTRASALKTAVTKSNVHKALDDF